MHNCAGIHVPMTIMTYMNTKANKQHIKQHQNTGEAEHNNCSMCTSIKEFEEK